MKFIVIPCFYCVQFRIVQKQIYVFNNKQYQRIYRVIRKSLRDFRPLRYISRDGHAEAEHVSRGRDTPSFCRTLQVLVMSTLGDAADVNPVIKFLPHTCNVCGVSPSVDMLPFGVIIPATVPQRSEIPEGLTNYPVYSSSIGTTIRCGLWPVAQYRSIFSCHHLSPSSHS